MKLTTDRLVLLITFLGLLAMAARPAVDTDTWWHLRVGAWIVAERTVPRIDVFSHTFFGAPWLYPSAGWLAEVLLYGTYTALGYAGLNLFTALCALLGFVFIYRTCDGSALLRAFVLVLAGAAAAIFWSARPQMLSFTLAAVFAWVLHEYRWRGSNRLWLLPPLMTLWVNLHGGFAIGFLLLGLTLAGQGLQLAWRWLPAALHPPDRGTPSASLQGQAGGELRAIARAEWTAGPHPGALGPRGLVWLGGIGLLCALAACLNPSGPVMLLYPFQTWSLSALKDFVQEWQSPDFQVRHALPFLWLLFATLGAAALSGRRADLTDLLLVLGLAYLGFLAWRNVALLAITAPPLLTRHAVLIGQAARERLRWSTAAAPPPVPQPGMRAPALNWALLTLVAAAAFLKVGLDARPSVNQARAAQIVPVAAADYVRQARPPGPLFNAYNFGGYLAWALYPDYPVFVDGRTDLYPDSFLRTFVEVTLGRPGYQATLDRYGVRLVLIETNSLLADALAGSPLWRLAHRDPLAVVFERVGAP